MNILIINHYAGSPYFGMAYRPYYLAKEFINMGHNVSIIGASFSHLRSVQPQCVRELNENNIDGIKYYWIKTPKYKSNRLRIINILTFVFKLFYYGDKISRMVSPDIVIASSTYPLDIYPSYRISKKSKAKLCFEVHDLWPLSPMVIGDYSKYHPYIYVLQKAENFAYKHSDFVVSLLKNSKKYMIDHGLDPDKFIHIPNGYDKEELEKKQEPIPNEHYKIISSLKKDGKIIVGYAGGHAPSNAMNTFVDTAKMFLDNNKVFFVSVGNGPSKYDLQSSAKELKNIAFLPPVAKRSIHNLLSLFDILYIGFVKSDIHKFGISPNKLIDYMLAGKPIILSADVENEVVESINCGITVPAENPTAVCDAINRFLDMPEEERIEMGLRGKNYTLKEFGYNDLACKFLNSIIDH